MRKLSILFFFISLNITYIFLNSNDRNDNKETWRERKFTIEELSKYNGKNGMPVYVAVDGIVYDVSKSKYWKTGKHKNLHDAGADLTYEIKNLAPKFHKGGKILEKFPKVGVLKVEKSTDTSKEKINDKKIEQNTKEKDGINKNLDKKRKKTSGRSKK